MNRFYISLIAVSMHCALQSAVPFEKEPKSGRASSVSLRNFTCGNQFQRVSDTDEEDASISESVFGVKNIFTATPIPSGQANAALIRNITKSSFKDNALYKWWTAVWAKLTMCFPSKKSNRN